MAALACRNFRVFEMPGAVLAVHTGGLLLDDVFVAGCAIDRLQTSAMPAAIGADMTFQTLGFTVRRQREIRLVVVAFETRFRIVGCARHGHKKQAGSKYGEEDSHAIDVLSALQQPLQSNYGPLPPETIPNAVLGIRVCNLRHVAI